MSPGNRREELRSRCKEGEMAKRNINAPLRNQAHALGAQSYMPRRQSSACQLRTHEPQRRTTPIPKNRDGVRHRADVHALAAGAACTEVTPLPESARARPRPFLARPGCNRSRQRKAMIVGDGQGRGRWHHRPRRLIGWEVLHEAAARRPDAERSLAAALALRGVDGWPLVSLGGALEKLG
jgi:hypothetical protein